MQARRPRSKRTDDGARRKRAKLVVLEGGRRTSPGTIEVPTRDASGSPLPAWRVARWHLICAANLLAAEYCRRRGEKGAEDLARARAVAMQLYVSLDPGEAWRSYGPDDLGAAHAARARLLEMARASDFALKTARSDAEAWLLEALPATVEEARALPDRPEEGDRARNLAHRALGCLAAQAHADAGKVLRRWGVSRAEDVLASRMYWEDVGELASAIVELLDEGDELEVFGRRLVRRTYRLLGLKHPFEAEKKKQRGRR